VHRLTEEARTSTSRMCWNTPPPFPSAAALATRRPTRFTAATYGCPGGSRRLLAAASASVCGCGEGIAGRRGIWGWCEAYIHALMAKGVAEFGHTVRAGPLASLLPGLGGLGAAGAYWQPPLPASAGEGRQSQVEGGTERWCGVWVHTVCRRARCTAAVNGCAKGKPCWQLPLRASAGVGRESMAGGGA